MTDKHFIRKYDARDNEGMDEHIERLAKTQAELQDTISFLIHHRELLRDCEIEVLQQEAASLAGKLADTKRKILVEELNCFREVLSLHRRLLDDQSKR